MSDITPLIDKYYAWLRDKTAWKTIDKWIEITAPYLDRNNDYIQIYLKKTDDGYLLTDGGATISGLLQEGCSLDSLKRHNLLKLTLSGYGVTEDNASLQVKATPDNFAFRKHSLLQAILSVNDMFYLATPHIASLFFEDVRNWLDISQIRYAEQISFIGHSGYSRKFDFLIPKSSNAPERIIKTINNPTRNSADAIIIDWIDTKNVRPEHSRVFSIINDNERNVPPSLYDALNNYDMNPVIWSKKESFRKELAA